jgi:hypothetical protein
LEANLEDDYKDYKKEETKGFHMFPPVYSGNHAPDVDSEIQRRKDEAEHEFEGRS